MPLVMVLLLQRRRQLPSLSHSLSQGEERESTYEVMNRLVSVRVMHHYIGNGPVHETVTEYYISK